MMQIPIIAHTGNTFTNKKVIDNREMAFVHQHYHRFIRLNPKEKQLLTLLGDGWRHKDIADNLCTGFENIRKQMKVINNKLELTHSKFNKASIYTKYSIYFGLIETPESLF